MGRVRPLDKIIRSEPLEIKVATGAAWSETPPAMIKAMKAIKAIKGGRACP